MPSTAGRVAPAAPSATGRRRRPSGEPPPLPRHLPPGTAWYGVVLTATAALWGALLLRPSLRALTGADLAMLRAVAHARQPLLTSVARAIDHIGSPTVVRVGAWTIIAVLLASRRFQHLVAYLAALLAVSVTETVVAVHVARIRPVGVTILAPWSGYAHPSRPVAGVAVVAVGAAWTLAPAGRWRHRAALGSAAVLAGLCLARLYLAVDHPTDVLAAVALGWALPALLYSFATPDESFPVTYGYRPRAHLDIGGARGVAIRTALDHQLGLHVISVEPFGLGGSAGSTPLLVRARRGESGTETALFAKLYARNHLRSDRLYKLARSIRYGRLEDELPFSSVRRLAEYEDHLLRLFRDLGLPAPRSYGLVEITPEREYLLVMEFVASAQELGTSPVSDHEIDEGLAIVRTMWDAGVAHRDIKPSNVLVRNGELVLIDVAFAAVRPTPWRQAVDLANMMLTLALASSAKRVYARALRLFTPDEIAEAFAASHGVTVPLQLKSRLRADGRSLDASFRALAPRRSTVAVQRWTVRRVASTLAVVAVSAGAVWAGSVYARSAGLL